jgi:lathosterol oxidase
MDVQDQFLEAIAKLNGWKHRFSFIIIFRGDTMNELNRFIIELSLWKFWVISWISFSLLYFGFAIIAEWLSHRLFPALDFGRPLRGRAKPQQISIEIRYSIVSITVFAFYGLLTKILITEHILTVNWKIDPLLLPLEIIGLFLWNELHFYICHRLLHTKWFYKQVHVIHHRSTTPTAFSTYSFHWFEAVLLGSVMIIAMFIFHFQWLALLSLPLTSITFNAIGHFHYDIFPDKRSSHLLSFSKRHSLHHSHNKGNYGFLLPIFDRLFGSSISKNSEGEASTL